jgi:CTP synthase
MVEQLEKAGLSFVAKDSKGERMEIIELPNHPWFVAAQYHPEYLSRVLSPSKASQTFSASSSFPPCACFANWRGAQTVLGFFAASAGCLDQVTENLANGAQR